jgi:hypothetical protein
MLQIDTANKQAMLMQNKARTLEGWLKHPEKDSCYKDDWCLGDLYGRPMDWRKQRDKYNGKIKTYEKEKTE